MAARGLLPLAQVELLEALVALRADDEQEVAQAAQATPSLYPKYLPTARPLKSARGGTFSPVDIA